ncbi:hypothetical protein QBC45DRAFT_419501 [Copromyces sp. CBS 386.78]|nr:hypothetical protein QBC45DRAFT_419501 [Copromyces sp. CBS 386.78]
MYNREAQEAIDWAAMKYKLLYNKKHRPLSFHVGDMVMVRLHKGYYNPLGEPSRKFGQQRIGPFKVTRKIGDLAYELDIPGNWGIHKVISIAHLRKCQQDKDPYDRDSARLGCQS